MKVTTSIHTYQGYPARIIHYHERFGMSYTMYYHKYHGRGLGKGDPEVMQRIMRAGEVQPKLSPEIERWLFGLLRECTFGRLPDIVLRQAYAHLLAGDRAYNNFAGWETRQSVVLKVNLGAEWMQMGYALPNGATVRVIGREETVAGKRCLPILALDVLDPATLKATYKTDPFTIACATNCVTDPQPNGLVDPFPVLGELGYSTPIPLLTYAQDHVWVESEWIERLPDNTAVRQYPYYRTNYKTVRW